MSAGGVTLPASTPRALASTTSAMRAADRQRLGVCSLASPAAALVLAEPAGKSTGIHARERPSGTRPELLPPEAQRTVLMRMLHGRVHGGTGVCHPTGGIHGDAEDFSLAVGTVLKGQPSGSCEERVGDTLPANDDETSRYVRLFLARAHRRGSRGILQLVDAFRAAACAEIAAALGARQSSAHATLDQRTFSKVCVDYGLAYCQRECACVFRHFARGGPLLAVDALIAEVRIALSPKRSEVVREVWKRLDPGDCGSVRVVELMLAFDPRKLGATRLGATTVEQARNDFFEGLGVLRRGVSLPPGAEHALDEVAARRRPQLAGTPGLPIQTPAGKPRAVLANRSPRDLPRELAAQRPAIDPEVRVTFEEFENFYAGLSASILEDEEFNRIVREPWTRDDVHADAATARHRYVPTERGRNPASYRVLASFQDGSSRKIVLRDDVGFKESTGYAGVDTGQIWAWGLEAREEALRRLKKQDGCEGICNVSLNA